MGEEAGTPDRDVGRFDRRAEAYEQGRLGALHKAISDRVVSLALATHPGARRVLDVGSGTGYVLRRLAESLPAAEVLSGVDPAPNMVRVSGELADDSRLVFQAGAAEQLPYPDGSFDLLVSTTSFDHWTDQAEGLRECARVLSPRGRMVLTDQFSPILWPTLLTVRRGKARTRERASRLIEAAGFREHHWGRLYSVLISSAIATR
jgi:ubiquinone/menaquinone biosynthesis C-methylase UbiE